jgi:CRP/FNR family transcriptional regulator, cyclic AMP receptor protein
LETKTPQSGVRAMCLVQSAVSNLSILRDHSIFGKLPGAAIERLSSHLRTRKVRRSATIFAKGEPGTALMAVISGCVRICVTSPNGREAVLNLIGEGEIFGEVALLDGHPRTADAVAISDCELMVIDRRDFIPFLRDNPEIAIKLIEVLCARLRRTSQQVEDVMSLNLPARLAKLVLRLAKEAGASSQGKISVSQREIGQMIGMSRESINKQLQSWARAKWVRLERGSIELLRPEPLEDLARNGLEPELA